ncbi:hypothetical protein [Sphingomonas psychrotolerans]|uniref:Uncharacterized protein n=1 Tax=Sphingomonas psychrotolerans TaxID=1327635 RepID=A0A2K8MB90_9SPHN|nr:hypothetical protein [Sphingomonas psychrotolerans]ATY31152.1 hypothetical protein CVN68_03455 [Sphingomonas psychrotolerans]
MIAPFLLALQVFPASGPAPERYDGKMTVTYVPIYCNRAPCPPGNFSIQMSGHPRVSVKTLHYEPPPGVQAPGRRQGDGVSIEGSVTFVRNAQGRAAEAVIVPRRVADGLWKP